MKKRFQNILTRSNRKNGFFPCLVAICITFLSGMLIGCSAGKSDPSEEPVRVEAETIPAGLEEPANTQAEDGSTQADSADDGSTELSNDTQNGTIADPIEQPVTLEENNYKSVLLGESSFICTDLAGKSLNISEIGQAVASDDDVAASAAATKFAVVDLDGDGAEEIVLWLQFDGSYDGGFEILHDQNGEIYGYTLWYRAFMDLKTDGTFLFSSGAADSGIGTIHFSETGYSVNRQAYSQSGYDANNEGTVQYFVKDKECSEDEFYAMLDLQEQKADAEWYHLSKDKINAVLK